MNALKHTNTMKTACKCIQIHYKAMWTKSLSIHNILTQNLPPPRFRCPLGTCQQAQASPPRQGGTPSEREPVKSRYNLPPAQAARSGNQDAVSASHTADALHGLPNEGQCLWVLQQLRTRLGCSHSFRSSKWQDSQSVQLDDATRMQVGLHGPRTT